MPGGLPTKIKIKGELYKAVVLVVTGTDEQGRPKQLEVLYDNEEVDVREKNTFIIAFTKESNLAPMD